ncbi:MAG: cupin domain-containing protein [Acidobacteriia bacterium]|nr:cupin domain-containing protein [Methyloceanibacter sp.]MBX5472143.1 cupin domain-containing protein [Acetobacteraceae bacterium]MCL6492632.1 cupin domain-containing protein [Terriglobia bacterium]
MSQAEPAAVARKAKTRIVAETPELRVTEYELGKGEALPWHFHSEVTDHFYCLQGVIRVALREGGQEWLLRPGESCIVPPQQVHRSSNADEGTSRYLLIQGIGRHDFIKAD